jgi:RNA polymerase sigma-70 factor (ECF subfamily)
VDWLRRNGRRAGEEELDGDTLAEPDGAGDPGRALLGKQRAERVRAALDRLAEPQRAVVHLHRFEGLGFAEIGKILGITEGAAKLRAFRAYAQLRTLLSDLVAEEPS